jgi:hypothetical protein
MKKLACAVLIFAAAMPCSLDRSAHSQSNPDPKLVEAKKKAEMIF